MKELFFSISTLLFFVQISSACSCSNTMSIEDAVGYYQYVFIGTVQNKEMVEIRDSAVMKQYPELIDTPNIYYLSKYKLEIEYLYKGRKLKKQQTIDLYTGIGYGDCGYHFKIGEKYVIFGTSIMKSFYHNLKDKLPKNIVYTSICSKTQKYQTEIQTEIEKYKRRRKYN